MNYLDAIATVTAQLEHDDAHADQAVRIAMRLALIAWRHLGDVDAGWDRFGLQLLAVDELLPGLADVAVACDPPIPGAPSTVQAVAGMVNAVATRLDQVADDETHTLASRVAHEAAAIRLRTAAGMLP